MATDSTDGRAAGFDLDRAGIERSASASNSDAASSTVASDSKSGRRLASPTDGDSGNDPFSANGDGVQLTQASAIALIPKAGEWVVVRVRAGDEIALPFSLVDARGLLRDGDAELRLPNGGVVVLQGYLAAIEGEPPLQLTDANGDVVDLEDFIVAIDELQDLDLFRFVEAPDSEDADPETGAQRQQQTPIHDGGANFAPSEPITLLDGLQEAGALPGTSLLFGQREVEERTSGEAPPDFGPTDFIWSVVGDSSVVESGGAIYTVSYTGATLAPGQTMTIAVATNVGFDSALADATAGSDYTSVSTVLTFTGGGAASQTLSVSTIDDTIVEGSEDYTVTLAGQSVGSLGTSQANTNIIDNDGTNLQWNITGSSQINEGAFPGTYSVSYTGVTLGPGQTATISVQTSGQPGGFPNAMPNVDYTALSTVLTFTSGGATQQTVSVSTIQDTLVEGTEDFRVTLSSQSIGTISTSQATTNIIDSPDLQWGVGQGGALVNNVIFGEGDSVQLRVQYVGGALAPGQTATIHLATAGGFSTDPDATPGVDYTPIDTTLTFTGGGATFQTFAITAIDDTLFEGSEDFTVTVDSASVGSITKSQVNLTITDDEATAPLWNVFGETEAFEGDTIPYSVTYTGYTLAPGETAMISVSTAGTINGIPNATPGVDYTPISTMLTFTGGGVTIRTLAVSTFEDGLDENVEDFQVLLSAPSSGTIQLGNVVTELFDGIPLPFAGGESVGFQADDAESAFKINEIAVNSSVIAPDTGQTAHWIEFANLASSAQRPSGLSVQVLGAIGGIRSITLPDIAVPANGYIVLYEAGPNATWATYDAAGVLQANGSIVGGGSWHFGSDTRDRVGVNLYSSNISHDLFIANGASASAFLGAAAGWTQPALSGAGYAAAVGLFASFSELADHSSYNGRLGDVHQLFADLGLPGTTVDGRYGVFARVAGGTTGDTDSTDNWKTTSDRGGTPGVRNVSAVSDPGDPGEQIIFAQYSKSEPGKLGQTVVEAQTTGQAVSGEGGNDFLYGDDGDDCLQGAAGEDFLFGHWGNDRLFGSSGRDLIVDVTGSPTANNGDYLEGGSGDDILLGTYGASANAWQMVIIGDTSLVDAPSGADLIAGGNGSDTLLGDNIAFAGAAEQTDFLADPFNLSRIDTAWMLADNGNGADTILGYGGHDLIRGAGDADLLFGDNPSNPAILGDDVIVGDEGDDIAFGGPGNDTIAGGPNNDSLYGEDGNDTLDGGSGDIAHEPDNDLIDGGAGIDLLSLENGNGGVNFTLYEPEPGDYQLVDLKSVNLGIDWYREMEGVVGTQFNDTIVDLAPSDGYFDGGHGSDLYVAGPGRDTYNMTGAGDGDHDTLIIPDSWLAGEGPDTVEGFGTSNSGPEGGPQDYIDLDPIFDQLGYATASRDVAMRSTVIADDSHIQIDFDAGPGTNWTTIVVLENITSGITFGTTTSDDIQLGSL